MSDKNNDLDLDDFDDDLDISFGEDLDMDINPPADDRSPTTKLAAGFAEGAVESITNPNTILDRTKRILPEEYEVSIGAAQETYSTGKELYDTFVEESKTGIRDFKKASKKVLDKHGDLLPKGIRSKLDGLLEVEEENRISKEAQRNQTINSEMDAIFGSADNQSASVAAAQMEQAAASDAIKESAENTRHLGQMAQLDEIRQNLIAQTSYQDRITSRYQRKSLELRYQHLYVARDIREQITVLGTDTKTALANIVKNTALPDYKKIELTEAAGQTLRDALLGNLQSETVEFAGNFGRNLVSNLKNKVKEKAQGLSGALSETAGLIETLTDSDSPMGDPVLMAGSIGGNFAADWAQGKVSPEIRKRIIELANGDDQKAIIARKLLSVGKQSSNFVTNFPRWFNSWAQEETSITKEGSFFRGLEDSARQALGEGNTFRATDKLANQLDYSDGFSPAVFDNQTHRSVNEVIPEYLSRILAELQTSRECMGCEAGKADDRLKFNPISNKLETGQQRRDSLNSKVMSKTDLQKSSRGLYRTIKAIDQKDELSEDALKVLSQMVMENYYDQRNLTLEKLIDPKNFPVDADQQHVKEVVDMVRAKVGAEEYVDEETGDRRVRYDRMNIGTNSYFTDITKQFNAMKDDIVDPKKKVEALRRLGLDEDLLAIDITKLDSDGKALFNRNRLTQSIMDSSMGQNPTTTFRDRMDELVDLKFDDEIEAERKQREATESVFKTADKILGTARNIKKSGQRAYDVLSDKELRHDFFANKEQQTVELINRVTNKLYGSSAMDESKSRDYYSQTEGLVLSAIDKVTTLKTKDGRKTLSEDFQSLMKTSSKKAQKLYDQGKALLTDAEARKELMSKIEVRSQKFQDEVQKYKDDPQKLKVLAEEYTKQMADVVSDVGFELSAMGEDENNDSYLANLIRFTQDNVEVVEKHITTAKGYMPEFDLSGKFDAVKTEVTSQYQSLIGDRFKKQDVNPQVSSAVRNVLGVKSVIPEAKQVKNEVPFMPIMAMSKAALNFESLNIEGSSDKASSIKVDYYSGETESGSAVNTPEFKGWYENTLTHLDDEIIALASDMKNTILTDTVGISQIAPGAIGFVTQLPDKSSTVFVLNVELLSSLGEGVTSELANIIAHEHTHQLQYNSGRLNVELNSDPYRTNMVWEGEPYQALEWTIPGKRYMDSGWEAEAFKEGFSAQFKQVTGEEASVGFIKKRINDVETEYLKNRGELVAAQRQQFEAAGIPWYFDKSGNYNGPSIDEANSQLTIPDAMPTVATILNKDEAKEDSSSIFGKFIKTTEAKLSEVSNSKMVKDAKTKLVDTIGQDNIDTAREDLSAIGEDIEVGVKSGYGYLKGRLDELSQKLTDQMEVVSQTAFTGELANPKEEEERTETFLTRLMKRAEEIKPSAKEKDLIDPPREDDPGVAQVALLTSILDVTTHIADMIGKGVNGADSVLGTIRDVSLGTVRRVAGAFGSVYSGAFNLIGGSLGGIGGLAKGVGNWIGNRLSRRDPDAMAKVQVEDVYLMDETTPILEAKKMEAGVYFDAVTNKSIRSINDLRGIEGNVMELVNGKLQLVADVNELSKGLYDSNGKEIKTNGFFSKALGLLKGYASASLNFSTFLPRMAYKVGRSVIDKAIKFFNKPIDIYVKGEDKPRLLATIMKNGGYLNQATGRPIQSPKDINGEVVDLQGNVVLTLDDMKNGLVDVNGNPLSFISNVVSRIGGIVKTTAGAVKSAIGWQLKAIKKGVELTGAGAKKGWSLLRGKGSDGVDIAHAETPEEATLMVSTKQTAILNDIRDILDVRLPEPEKELRRGGWRETLQRQKQDDEFSRFHTKKGAEGEDKPKATKGRASVMGAIAGMLGLGSAGKGEEGDEFDLGDAHAAAELYEMGKEKLKGGWKKAKDWLGKGKGAIARAGGALLSSKAATAISGTALATKATGALAATKAAAVGAGAAVAGAISLPALAIGAAVATAAVGGYFLYKYFSAINKGDFTNLRFLQYGINPDDKEAVGTVLKLEEELLDYVTHSDGELTVKVTSEELKEIFEDAGIKIENEQALDTTMSWFTKYFIPVFITHLKALKEVDGDIELHDIDDDLEGANKVTFIKLVSDPSSVNPAYEGGIARPPFTIKRVAATDVAEYLTNLQAKVQTEHAEEKKTESKSWLSRIKGAIFGDDEESNSKESSDGKTYQVSSNGETVELSKSEWDALGKYGRGEINTLPDGLHAKLPGNYARTLNNKRLRALAKNGGKGLYGEQDSGSPDKYRLNSSSSVTGSLLDPVKGLKDGLMAKGMGDKVKHPGNGTKGSINDLPIPEGIKGWDSQKELITEASNMVGVDAGLMATMAAIESSFNSMAKAKTSSASGTYQFINSTWKTMLDKHGDKYGISPGTSQFDPRANALMGAEFLKGNYQRLQKALKRPITDTDLYLAHFLGASGAIRLLKANPNQKAAEVMPKAAGANYNIFYNKGRARTMEEVYHVMDDKVSKFREKYADEARTLAMETKRDRIEDDIQLAQSSVTESASQVSPIDMPSEQSNVYDAAAKTIAGIQVPQPKVEDTPNTTQDVSAGTQMAQMLVEQTPKLAKLVSANDAASSGGFMDASMAADKVKAIAEMRSKVMDYQDHEIAQNAQKELSQMVNILVQSLQTQMSMDSKLSGIAHLLAASSNIDLEEIPKEVPKKGKNKILEARNSKEMQKAVLSMKRQTVI